MGINNVALPKQELVHLNRPMGEMNTSNLTTILLRMFKRCLSILIILSPLFLSSCVGTGVEQVITAVGRDELSVSVLAINLQGIANHYGPNVTVNWDVRYQRMVDWMSSTGKFPDFIALQEVHGQSTSGNQYQVLHTFLTMIRAKSNRSYRVAYLAVNPIPYPGSTLWQGLALLYNADRLTNITGHTSIPVFNYGDLKTGFQARKSLPCQESNPSFAGLCNLIDGDGVFLICPIVRSFNKRWVTGPVLTRFELKGARGSPIHIYNVHGPLEDREEFLGQFQSLDSEVETILKLGNQRLYPPIVLGDFNFNVREVLTMYPGYEIAGYANREVMGVLVGDQNTYPSKQTAYARAMVLPVDKQDPSLIDICKCGDAGELWSDHCGLFVQFSPAPGTPAVLPSGLTATGSVMRSGEILQAGQTLSSTNGKYTLRLQSDSNLLLITNTMNTMNTNNTILWKSDSHGRPVGVCRLNERNLVIYEKDGNQMWTSSLLPDSGISSELVVQDDGNMVIYQLPGRTNPIWSSNTVQP